MTMVLSMPDHCLDRRTGDLTPDEIAVIALHEHLTLTEADQRGHAMLREPWGHAALRQMVWDVLLDARRRGDETEMERLSRLFRQTCLRFPNPYDRRHSPTRERHPFPYGGSL
ncbi:hypothetical protein [Azospirillum thermophilum]|uniref:Uncharacterized protein n=1 Tax=Azospirillum thermophilum TaxID=2202148 RepID=A0A2S2CY72_9PROT|nr:hypothetical protein [Azospirillum thermophilum]AWK89227.1 hypothetical protein DEW08_24970 [Azospirillum thermophilum]